MPPRLLIQSEKTRTSAIAVVMLAGLLMALGLAHVTTGMRRFVVANLELAVPRNWKPANPPLHLGKRLQAAVSYRASDQTSSILTAAVLPSVVPRTAQAALVEAIQILRGTPPQASELHSIRAHNVNGCYTRWLILVHKQPDLLTDVHIAAVLTDDGRHYWLVYLNQATRFQGRVTEHPPSAQILFDSIIDTARSRRAGTP